jgi:hypothetical protein
MTCLAITSIAEESPNPSPTADCVPNDVLTRVARQGYFGITDCTVPVHIYSLKRLPGQHAVELCNDPKSTTLHRQLRAEYTGGAALGLLLQANKHDHAHVQPPYPVVYVPNSCAYPRSRARPRGFCFTIDGSKILSRSACETWPFSDAAQICRNCSTLKRSPNRSSLSNVQTNGAHHHPARVECRM